MKYYLKFIVDRIDLFERMPNPRRKYFDIQVLTSDEVLRLIKACKNSRQLLIIQLLYETGIRIGEFARLKLSDFDIHFKTLIIRNSKNKVTRTINLGSKIIATLRKYLDEFKSIFSDTLLANLYHPFMALSTTGISWVIQSIVRRSGITKRVNPHSLRHAFAVHYINFGGSIYHLQKLLGHLNLKTTVHYLQYAILPEGKHISTLDSLFKFE